MLQDASRSRRRVIQRQHSAADADSAADWLAVSSFLRVRSHRLRFIEFDGALSSSLRRHRSPGCEHSPLGCFPPTFPLSVSLLARKTIANDTNLELGLGLEIWLASFHYVLTSNSYTCVARECMGASVPPRVKY